MHTHTLPRTTAAVFLGVFLTVSGCVYSPSAPDAGATRPMRPAAGKPARPDVSDVLRKTSHRLAAGLISALPRAKRVAVLPLADAGGGVRRLGALLAEGVAQEIIASGRRVVDRANLNTLLAERDFQLTTMASAPSRTRAGAIAGADILILGTTSATGREVIASIRAVDVQTGNVLAAGKPVSVPGAALGRLMWYVRRPGESGTLPPLSLQYDFITRGSGGETRLGDGSTVRAGQKFKIRVRPNSDCCLYVLLYGSDDQASLLFPHVRIGLSNQVRGGVSYEIPEGAKWYWFDDRPGRETFYVVASYEPLDRLDDILQQMQKAGRQNAAVGRRARTEIDSVIARGMEQRTAARFRPKGFTIDKGVGGVVELTPAGRSDDTFPVDSVVTGYATVVKKVVFSHR